MSSNYFDADWTEKVTLPVKRVGAHWEFFYGGDVPVREGTLYTRVFYCEGNGNWFPFDDLRRGVLVTAERNLLQSAWDEVENALGWRPTPPQPKNSKKSTKK